MISVPDHREAVELIDEAHVGGARLLHAENTWSYKGRSKSDTARGQLKTVTP
jgi:hypothetical protein